MAAVEFNTILAGNDKENGRKRVDEKSQGKISKPMVFFKCLITGDFYKKLALPPKFVVGRLTDESEKVATIVCPCGGTWLVDLMKVRKQEAYLQGRSWQNFVVHHYLKRYEVLLFKYEEKMHFSVKIFASNGCERAAFALTSKVISDQGRSKKRQMVNEGHEYGGQNKSKLCGERKMIKQQSQLDPGNKGRMFDLKSPAGVLRKRSEAILPFDSKNPFFQKTIKAYNLTSTGYLFLPNPFAIAHLPRMDNHIELINSEGKKWKVSYNYVSEVRKILSAGWPTFAREQKFEPGDKCVFELVGKNKMMVHVLNKQR